MIDACIPIFIPRFGVWGKGIYFFVLLNGIIDACTFVEVLGFINKEWLVETEADCVVQEE